MFPKKQYPRQPAEIPVPEEEPEMQPFEEPESPVLPEEEPLVIPEEEPGTDEPEEIPPPGKE